MRKPTEIQLKYRNDGNGIISMIVDPVEGAIYRWQYCRAKTADWRSDSSSNNNTYTITNPLNGDKYRCLIVVGDKVISYSKTLTIGQHKFRSMDEYSSQNRYSYQKTGPSMEDAYQEAGPSVEDTYGMDGLEFEAYCADVLKANGFYDVRVTQGSGDYGVDILAKKDSVTYAIQCKCYTSPVGNKAVQEAYSGKTFYNCMVAAVLTNNYFTDAAIETAKRNAVVLWDRDYLDSMIKNASFNSDTQREAERKEKERQERERKQRAWEEKRRKQEDSDSGLPDFFKGCSTWEQVRERYRKLMQMYHPDHETGDEEYAKVINDQYSKLKEKYGQ